MFYCSPRLWSTKSSYSECCANIKLVAVVLKGSLGLCCSQPQNMKRISLLPYLPLTPNDYSSALSDFITFPLRNLLSKYCRHFNFCWNQVSKKRPLWWMSCMLLWQLEEDECAVLYAIMDYAWCTKYDKLSQVIYDQIKFKRTYLVSLLLCSAVWLRAQRAMLQNLYFCNFGMRSP